MSAKKILKSSAPARLAPGRKWAFRLGLAVLVPLFLLGAIETALRLFHYGSSTDFFTRTSDGASFGVNEKFLFQFYSGNAAKGKTQPFLIPLEKPTGTVRIFVLGESAAQGTPEPAFGFARILEFMLRSAFPQQQFEVVNAAMRGVNSHILLPAARDCATKSPDLFILYIGNNEVVGLHAPRPDSTIIDRHLALSRAVQWLKSLRFGQWITRIAETTRSKPPKQDMEFFREHRVAFDNPERQNVYRQFEQNLEEICRAARRSGAKTVLSTIAVNLKDFPPIASLHRADLTPAQQAQWEVSYAKGAAAEDKGQYELALEHFVAASHLDDHYAELRFRLARTYDALGRFEEARREYNLACDWDALAFRADSQVNEAIRRVARDPRRSLGLVDVERAFAECDLSEHGVPGERLFHDHVHLKFDGDYLIAKTLFPAVAAALGKPGESRLPSRAQCAEALAFTRWGELQIDAGVVATRKGPPYLDQLGHAERQARAEQAINARQQQMTQADLQEAAAIFAAALAKNPQDWRLHQLYGNFALDRGDLTTALEQLRIPLSLFPDRVGFRIGYAGALARAGRRSDAIAQYQEVLRSDPGNQTANQALSWLYSQSMGGWKR